MNISLSSILRALYWGRRWLCRIINRKNESFPCEILGITTITDNENLTNSSETALHQLLTHCLAKTNLKTESIQGIKVHGVGGNSDEMEQSVLQELFPNTETILVKPYMGHTLGASGALETTF